MASLASKSSVLILLALTSAMAQDVTGVKTANRALHQGTNPPAITIKNESSADAEEVKLPDPVPIPEMSPEELPATPPKVRYHNGELTIDTDNATLGEVLNAIGKQIGAQIDIPPAADKDRVAVHLSGPSRRVIATLLNDGKFGYIILCPPEDPAGVQKVILTSQSQSDARRSSSQPMQTAIRRPPSSPLQSRPIEAGPTPEYPEFADTADAEKGNSDAARSADTAVAGIAAPKIQITPDIQLEENMAHAAQQLAEVTAQAPANASQADSTAQAAPNSMASGQAGSSDPMQVLQNLFDARRQLQVQQNHPQAQQQN
jgi:hypothetical protein